MIKKITAGLACLFVMTTAFTQQQNFVEVTISDTVHIDADEIVYLVRVQEDYTSEDTATVDSTTFPLRPVSIASKPDALMEVRRIIKEMSLDTLSDPSTIISNTRYYQISRSVRIRFETSKKLRQFIDRIKPIENVTGAVVQLKTAKEAEEIRRLFQQIIQKAKREAETLAQLSAKKLGTIASIQEKEVMGGWTSYPTLSGIPGWHAEISVINEDKIILQKQFSIRFHWQ